MTSPTGWRGSNRAARLEVAGLILELECEAGLAQALRRRYAAFQPLASKPSAAFLKVDCRPPAGALEPQLGVEGGRLDLHGPGFAGGFDVISRQGEMTCASPHPVETVDYLLRAVYALLVFEMGGLLFHSAGVVRSGRAYLFFGPSGSGKSTAARLSTGGRVINDDLVVLQPLEGQPGAWQAAATPFWNPAAERPNPPGASLAGLYRLVQARQVWRETVPASLALAEIVASVPVVCLDAARLPQLLGRCQELLQVVPVYRLHFLPDASFWQVV